MSSDDNLLKAREALASAAAARTEDIQWMADTGECLSGAAARLGIKREALEKWLTVHDMHDVLARLRARDPHMVTVDRSEIGRRNAEARWAS